MRELQIQPHIMDCQMDELSDAEQQLLRQAIEATGRSYAPHSHFHVGAALQLEDGTVLPGCNQENAAFPAGLCAERSALFAAGAQYPDVAPVMLAIAARNPAGELTPEPVSPCGTCRQVIIETETRYRRPLRLLLYGANRVYVMDGISNLMPLSFTEF
ncbi:MAG: cytidine deaminase [Prevotella sp.]|nr:cytidine deaminase [Prevotella sp.]